MILPGCQEVCKKFESCKTLVIELKMTSDTGTPSETEHINI